MRELKFRAWNKLQKVMCFDNEDNTADYWDGIHSSDLGMINFCLRKDHYVHMQYTGLKDKNGTDIYEGDIIKNHTPEGENHSAYDEIGVVIWDKTRIIAENKKHGNYFPIVEGHSEIIGNIYETAATDS